MTDFEANLDKLSVNELIILQCLSIFWEPITTQDFQKLLNALEIRAIEGKSNSFANLNTFRNWMMEMGLLEQFKEFWGSGFRIPDERGKEILFRRAMSQDWFDDIRQTIQEEFNLSEYAYWNANQERRKHRLLRDYRLSIYLKRIDESFDLYEKIEDEGIPFEATEIIIRIFSEPFQKDFLNQFDPKFQGYVLPSLLIDAMERACSTDELWEFVDENKFSDFQIIKSIRIDDLLFKGKVSEARKLAAETKTLGAFLATAIIEFLNADFSKSIQFFEEMIKIWRDSVKQKKGHPNAWQMFFYGLALYKTDESKFHKFVELFYVYASKNYPYSTVAFSLKAVSFYLRNNENSAKAEYRQIVFEGFEDNFLCVIVAAIIPDLKAPDFSEDFLIKCRDSGFKWIAYETANLLRLQGKSDYSAEFDLLKGELGFEPVGDSIPRLEVWERALNTLAMIATQSIAKKESKGSINKSRVVWQLDFKRRDIQPLEQKYGKNGWTKGRNISLKRLSERDVKSLTEQDALIVKKALKRYQSGYYYGGYEFEFVWEKAIEELVGHPFLFLKTNPTVNVQLNHAEPHLVIKEVGEDLELSFDTEFTEEGVIVQKETEVRYKVVKISPNHVEIANSLKNGALTVPAKGREKLLKAIQPLTTKIAVQSDLEEHFENLPLVEVENRIHALITPAGEGFHLEFFVKPFGSVPPYIKPGKGNESVVAEIDGIRTRAKRDLPRERELLKEVEEACPFLADYESPNYDWYLSGAEECLTAMSEMETPRKAEKLVVEWTKGQKLRLLGNVNFENLSLSVKGKNNWFEVSGEIAVNEELVLSMQELSNLLTNENTNFVELSDGQFIAITEKLRKHLQSLNAVMDGKNRIHSLRSGILEEFSEELANFKADKAWRKHLENIENAQKFVPVLPPTFEADFRPYQIDGYFWLSRLANWGVGACLADDMGLGKTLMALAILVEKAEKGAALVVAPVSVCRNWVKEAQRFAPTLNFHIFGEGDRKLQLESLGKYDVLVTSYNLLQLEEELFTKQKFATIVLDEAQAIKNRTTKRSKAVMKLEGDFRVITTGTPIENHLGELWNLFDFLNPGLLGSHEFFKEKFAVPIEKDNDDNARKTLQRLIKPFILRRRKNQVLDDLPEKTEIVLTVEMSPEERAFYVAIRREALDNIEAKDGETKNKRFRILAELTKLRLACCHPKLVYENTPLESSKLELFGETLEELLENKHKALVFSQFVKHLKIVKDYLDKKGISYQYLDGSTPPNVRQERIEDFQRGSRDVFLISLKAGGTGLNLTAADYVIHLDPWWNPAVEDQATDRVHRIGQHRPVTVYRLVTENTVEEKILKLHETKRDLADSLLDGTDSSGKLSADDLLALISEV